MRTSCERPPLTIARAAPAARAAGSARAGHCAFQFLHDATQDDSDRVIIRVSHHRLSVAGSCLTRAVPGAAATATAQSVRRRDVAPTYTYTYTLAHARLLAHART